MGPKYKQDMDDLVLKNTQTFDRHVNQPFLFHVNGTLLGGVLVLSVVCWAEEGTQLIF